MEQSVTGTVAVVVWGTALAGVLDWFWLNWLAVWVYAILLLLDFWFGVLEAYMRDRNSVKSDTAMKGLIRKMIRLLLPFMIVLILKWAGLEDVKIVIDSIISILVLTEWYSIIWHVVSIDQGKQLPEIDAFQWLCEWVANLLKKGIKDKIPEEKEK